MEEFDGIKSLSKGAFTEDKTQSSLKGKGKASTEEDDTEVPILINRDYANLSAVLQKADVVLEVLDSRDPLAHHSSDLVNYTKEKEKKLILVINKIGTSEFYAKRVHHSPHSLKI